MGDYWQVINEAGGRVLVTDDDVPASVYRNAVQTGDTITWRTRNGGHQASGVVQWATREAVHVEIPGRGIYAVEWPRVESVTPAHTHPRGVICSPAWCGSDGPNAGVLDR